MYKFIQFLKSSKCKEIINSKFLYKSFKEIRTSITVMQNYQVYIVLNFVFWELECYVY